MKDIYISRRNFIKSTVASYIFTQTIFPVFFSKGIEKDDNSTLIIDKDYILINGWVLLKSDVALG